MSGSSGVSGSSGTSGANGTSGSSGTSGANGSSGTSGLGSSGTSGSSGQTGSSGTSGVDGVGITGGSITIYDLSGSNYTNNTTTVSEITGLTTGTLAAGTYHFKYVLIAQSSATANSMKFAVNSTATTSTFMYNLFFPSAGVTAATGVMDQEVNATTGNVWAFAATRVKNTTIGPFTDVDTQNADIMVIVEGIFIASTTGVLSILGASETTGTITVKIGSGLILTKLA